MGSVFESTEQYGEKFSGITSDLLNVSGILPIIPVFPEFCLHLMAQSAQTV